MNKEEVTVGEFVSRLIETRHQNADISLTELLRYGHFRGWLEDQDERYPNATLNRQTTARILHQFLRLECGLPDLADISPALKLRDLYTCRACAEHIAQVYTRGLMPADTPGDLTQCSIKKKEPDTLKVSDSSPESSLFFNHLAQVTTTEAQLILEKLLQLIA